ncbi:MAG: hypothetical protein P1V35_03300 [Planctomycetota bacterium]|nr:hypothetical protein [Planctomycetota bacterium]
MKLQSLALLGLFLPLTACASTTIHTSGQSHDPLAYEDVELRQEARTALFDAVASLEGNWSTDDGSTTSFEVTSGGSVIREIIFAGQPHEMTNMYSLDGNGLNMTHFCAAGNQPHMRATSIQDSSLVFARSGVSGRQSADENYMGAMTLTIVDEDTMQQSWTSYQGDNTGDGMVFTYKRTD